MMTSIPPPQGDNLCRRVMGFKQTSSEEPGVVDKELFPLNFLPSYIHAGLRRVLDYLNSTAADALNRFGRLPRPSNGLDRRRAHFTEMLDGEIELHGKHFWSRCRFKASSG